MAGMSITQAYTSAAHQNQRALDRTNTNEKAEQLAPAAAANRIFLSPKSCVNADTRPDYTASRSRFLFQPIGIRHAFFLGTNERLESIQESSSFKFILYQRCPLPTNVHENNNF